MPHPLALAAGEGADACPAFSSRFTARTAARNGRPGVPQPLQGGHVVQKLGDGQLVEVAEVLGQVAEAGLQPPLRHPGARGASVHQDVPLRGRQGGHQQLHQGGLARPVGPQQPNHAGGPQVQAQALQRLLTLR